MPTVPIRPESPPPRPPKRPWHVAMIPRLTLVSVLLGAVCLVVAWRRDDRYHRPDDREQTMRSQLEDPHWASERFDTVIMPATERALADGTVDRGHMLFRSSSEPSAADLDLLRLLVQSHYGDPGAALVAVWWEWDDAVIAALNDAGTAVVDQRLLEATLAGGYADKIRAAEDEFSVKAQAWLDDFEWSQTVDRWTGNTLPWAMLAFFLVLPLLGLWRYIHWMDRHDEGEGGWRDSPPLVPALAAGPSGAGEGEVADDQADAGGAHGQPVHVATHLDDVEEHPLEGGGDGELP